MKRSPGSWKTVVEQLAVNNPKIMCGMFDAQKWPLLTNKQDCLYFDNPYFLRHEKHDRFRLVRGGSHLTKILPYQERHIYQPPLKPWRTDGKGILIIPPSDTQIKIYGAQNWLAKTMKRLRRTTGRHIVIKENKKHPLSDFLRDAWAVVTFGSVAGVEAAIAGVPVFAGPQCPALPISAGFPEDIEDPEYCDRREWLRSLAYACWTVADLPYIDLENYDYTCRHHGA